VFDDEVDTGSTIAKGAKGDAFAVCKKSRNFTIIAHMTHESSDGGSTV
jgi:hypothetical protein